MRISRARGLRSLLRRAPRKQRRGFVEAAHWAFGASGGAAFGALPRSVRGHPWAGPLYGLVVWLGFELGLAPVLGLSQAKRARPGRPPRAYLRPSALRPRAVGHAPVVDVGQTVEH
jgi:hypothetical protein